MSEYADEQLWEAHQSVYEPESRMPFEWALKNAPYEVDSMRAVAERVRTEERAKALQDAYEAVGRQVQLASLVAGRPSDFEKGVMSALAAIRAVSAEQEDHHDPEV